MVYIQCQPHNNNNNIVIIVIIIITIIIIIVNTTYASPADIGRWKLPQQTYSIQEYVPVVMYIAETIPNRGRQHTVSRSVGWIETSVQPLCNFS